MTVLCFSGCSSENDLSYTPARSDTLVWYLPCDDIYRDTAQVNKALNDCIHETYPDLDIELNFINKYEYTQKVSVYISSNRKADLVWANDTVLPYVNLPYNNEYKFLDSLISNYAPNIQSYLKNHPTENYNIYDKKYFVPVAFNCDGFIPFIKIPENLKQYMDTAKLIDIVNNSSQAEEELFEVINDYLDTLNENGLIADGIDYVSLSPIFPAIGYETFVSTSELIGYRLDDETHTAVDMLNKPSTLLSYKYYSLWKEKGYIRDDISITYKQSDNSPYDYVLGGIWGYRDNNGNYYMTSDGIDNDIYIMVDNKSHPGKLYTSSSVVIPAKSRKIESAIKILDLFYTDKRLYDLVTFGIKDKHYTEKDGIAEVKGDGYRCIPGIVPGPPGKLTTVSESMIISSDLKEHNESASMFIPASSTEFRKLLFNYTNSCKPYPYDTALPYNANAGINNLLDTYNSKKQK